MPLGRSPGSSWPTARQRLTVDPYLGNDRAIRAWTKAGFQPVGEREPDDEHSRRWLEMEFHGWA